MGHRFTTNEPVRNYLNETFPGQWVGRGGTIFWPPRFLHLTTADFLHLGMDDKFSTKA